MGAGRARERWGKSGPIESLHLSQARSQGFSRLQGTVVYTACSAHPRRFSSRNHLKAALAGYLEDSATSLLGCVLVLHGVGVVPWTYR